MSTVTTEPTVKCSTLVELLRMRAEENPHRRLYTFLSESAAEVASLTYAELDSRARAYGACLQSRDARGERVLLIYPPGLEFIAAFFGCLYAGAVAVPAYPPRLNRSLSRVQSIISDAQATIAFTTQAIFDGVKPLFQEMPGLKTLEWLTAENISDGVEDDWHEPGINSEALAFLQYTSGSTSAPKGVMLNHGNLLHNEQLIQLAFQHTERSIVVGWLPLYHDMGLIGNMLQPLYVGARCILMSPMTFLQRPFRWLQAISRYRATTSGGPDFAYDLCVRKVTDEQRATIDLSSWDLAFNGAEPIRHDTLERFTASFAACGFRRETFFPCYGLAEATLIVSGGVKAAPPVIKTVQAEALESNRVIVDCPNDEATRSLVGCGATLLDQHIVIADPEALTKCKPDEVGEIWVSGPSVAKGYWNRVEATENTFRAYLADTGEGPFLRTGDFGFIHDGELLVTGRVKDLVIIDGRNHYPQDIELTVEQSHPAIRAGCCAAFSVDIDDKERLVIVAEVERRYRDVNQEEIVKAVRRAVAEHHDLRAHAISLLKPGSIPKTSSGKLQRFACRANFLADSDRAINSEMTVESKL